VTFAGTGNADSFFMGADADAKPVVAVLGATLIAAGRDCGIVSKIRNIVSIFVFMAPIWRSRSAILLPPAGGPYDGLAEEKSREGNFPLFAGASCGPPKQSVQ
jgi:hypothetical protein